MTEVTDYIYFIKDFILNVCSPYQGLALVVFLLAQCVGGTKANQQQSATAQRGGLIASFTMAWQTWFGKTTFSFFCSVATLEETTVILSRSCK